MGKKRISRRTFVRDTTAAAAFTIVPRHVLGRGFLAPSDKLSIAAIGCGGKGRSDIEGVAATENIYALCDVDSSMALDAVQKYPKAKRFKDYREMLDKEGRNIDAVTVSIPDHSHAAAGTLAMKAGKHAFIQKPLARTLGEVRALELAAKKYKVATQMGNQGHAGEGVRKIRELVEAGAIGTVKEVRFWTNRPWWPQGIDRPLQEFYVPATLDWNLWLGPAPERPYNPAYAPFKWRGWWDFGTGTLGDMACHIMDAAFWTLDLGFPTRVEPESQPLFKETAPAASRITWSFPAKGSRSELKVVWSDNSLYPARPAEVGDEAAWPPDTGGGQLWTGTDGKLVAGTYADDPTLLDPARQADVVSHPPAQKYTRSPGVYAEWIAACKGGPPANSAFDTYSGPFTEMVMLGCLAVRMGRTLEVNPQTGQITNVQVPAEYITPTYRPGWSLAIV